MANRQLKYTAKEIDDLLYKIKNGNVLSDEDRIKIQSIDLSCYQLINDTNINNGGTVADNINHLNNEMQLLKNSITESGDVTIINNGNITLQLDVAYDGLKPCACDGKTDDSSRFQLYVNYISSRGGGTLTLPNNKTIMIRKEIELKNNINIVGQGIGSKIITDVGESQNGLNMLKAFDKKNIYLGNFYIENVGYGLSGSWEPMGTFDGVGSCILAAGCHNFVVDNCYVTKGGGNREEGKEVEGVANIYLSCCYNSKVINCHVEYGDNGIMADTWWRYIDDAHKWYENDGIVFANNTIQHMTGRGICIENKTNKDKPITKGNVTVVGNTMRFCSYAGIQGNNLWNTVVTGNTIHGDCTDVDGTTVIVYGKSTGASWYGIAFEDETFQCIISDNVIKNIKYRGIYCKNAQNTIISNNNIIDAKVGSSVDNRGHGIYVLNDEYKLYNVNVIGNNIYNYLTGVTMTVDNSTSFGTIETKNCMISNNNIAFTDSNSRYGIDCSYLTYSKIDNNLISLTANNDTFNGIKCSEGKYNTLNSNSIDIGLVGINLVNDKYSISNDNLITNCTNGYILDGCTATILNSKLRSCTNGFNVSNGQSSSSAKCKAFNGIFEEVTNIKTGTGVLVRILKSSAPTSGTWETGDRVLNYTPASGSYAEWVYVNNSWKGLNQL